MLFTDIEGSTTLLHALGPASAAVRNLGRHGLKDLPKGEHLFQMDIAGLPRDFPPPRTHEAGPAAAGAALAHVRRRHRRRVILLSAALVATTLTAVPAIAIEGSIDTPPAPPG